MGQKGRIAFTTSDASWNEGFAWAKKQALSYSHEGDLVGDWYEAALPNRQAFCMRDVAHHARGAQALGLGGHTKNMLHKFAQGIARERQFCSFWEIDKDDRPCPVDYTNDRDFWYNLPANFDVMDACWRMYGMTGDPDYLQDPAFVRFYRMTVEEYAKWWDRDGDGLLERRYPGSRLGIPSYCEDSRFAGAQALLDLLAIEIRGYWSGSLLFGARGDMEQSAHCARMAKKLEQLLQKQWWDEKGQKYYRVKDADGVLQHSDAIGHALSLAYYRVVTDPERLARHLEALHEEAQKGVNVESLSHYPVLFYQNGQAWRGAFWLKELVSPGLHRREYPEVSYAAVEAFVYEMAGICPDGPKAALEVFPKLPEGVSWFEVQNLPFLDGEVDIAWKNGVLSAVNKTGQTITVNKNQLKAGEASVLTGGRTMA